MKQLTDEVFAQVRLACEYAALDRPTLCGPALAALAAAKQAQPERASNTKGRDQVWFAQNYKQGGQHD